MAAAMREREMDGERQQLGFHVKGKSALVPLMNLNAVRLGGLFKYKLASLGTKGTKLEV